MRGRRRRGIDIAGSIAPLLVLCGCQHHLMFATATKFGVDISQRADRMVEVSFGYDRAEVASIPTDSKDANLQEDAYSVIGTFCVDYGAEVFTREGMLPLTVRQRFGTGMAAQKLANNENFRKSLGRIHEPSVTAASQPQTAAVVEEKQESSATSALDAGEPTAGAGKQEAGATTANNQGGATVREGERCR